MPKTSKTKPFLVLPLLESEVLERTSPNIFDMPMKNPGMQLFTKTWPPNKKVQESDENKRPLTATLEKPTILDIRLIGKIDMSKIRKEFLNISNLCRMPLLIKKSKNSKLRRPLSLPPTDIDKKKKKLIHWDDVSVGEEESTRSVKVTGRHAAKLGKIDTKRTVNACDNNNNHSKHLRTPRKHPPAIPISEKLPIATVPAPSDTKSSSSTKLTQPCNSCGRSDQPERLHSHPAIPNNKIETSPKLEVKSTVQKPVAIKYKSKAKTKSEEEIPSPSRKYSLPAQNLVHSNPPSATMSKLDESRANYKKKVSSSRKGLANKGHPAKITLTCYICGREYGSKSLPLHEPRCLEKWERENSLLPRHLRRKPPQKPSIDATNKDEWNAKAWESAQGNLVPCPNCGRTFYPDRLEVHLRSCKSRPKNGSIDNLDLLNHSVQAVADIRTNPNLLPQSVNCHMPPQNWQCYICKKKFSGNSIREHEKRCLKQWQMENENQLERSSSPLKKRGTLSPGDAPGRVLHSADNNKESNKADRPVSARKPPLFPCYLCGKLFSVNSIYIHEPQCLKKWHIENNKLPSNKRRQVPQKPDIKFTQEGKISFAETQEANWQSHLSQLVPCKHCKRTFNPDRVEIHERSCRGA